MKNAFYHADSLVQSGQLMAGLVEYERIVFNSEDYANQQKAIFAKALAWKQNAKYQQAIRELERIGVRNPENPLFAAKAYELAFCQYMTAQYRDALGTLSTYGSMLPSDHPDKRKHLTLEVLCYNHLFEFEKAKSTLDQLGNHLHDKSDAENILALYSEAPKYKDPEKARHLSILPGLGQVYCGAVFEGGVSFLLNASALGFGAWQVYSGYYFTGYVVGVTLLQKFHSGGQHRAEILARQKNREHMLDFNVKVINRLQTELDGNE